MDNRIPTIDWHAVFASQVREGPQPNVQLSDRFDFSISGHDDFRTPGAPIDPDRDDLNSRDEQEEKTNEKEQRCGRSEPNNPTWPVGAFRNDGSGLGTVTV